MRKFEACVDVCVEFAQFCKNLYQAQIRRNSCSRSKAALILRQTKSGAISTQIVRNLVCWVPIPIKCLYFPLLSDHGNRLSILKLNSASERKNIVIPIQFIFRVCRWHVQYIFNACGTYTQNGISEESQIDVNNGINFISRPFFSEKEDTNK